MVSSEGAAASTGCQHKKQAGAGANSGGEDAELMDFSFSSSLMLEGDNAASVKVDHVDTSVAGVPLNHARDAPPGPTFSAPTPCRVPPLLLPNRTDVGFWKCLFISSRALMRRTGISLRSNQEAFERVGLGGGGISRMITVTCITSDEPKAPNESKSFRVRVSCFE